MLLGTVGVQRMGAHHAQMTKSLGLLKLPQ